MKMKKIKVLTSAALSCIILLNGIIPTFASNITDNIVDFDPAEIIEVDDALVESEKAEEKYICKATIEDDFEDDAVLVMFNNKTSLEFKEYKASDFKGIGVVSVEQSEINKTIGNKIKNYLEVEADKELEYKDSLSSYTNDSINSTSVDFAENGVISDNKVISTADEAIINSVDEEDVEEYNQVIKLNLNEHSKQNVIDAVKELEKRDDVLIAEPNYSYYLCKMPNDTYLSKQSAYIDKIDLDLAWNITTGSKNVKVGVVDTGIKRSHPDLTANVDANLKFASPYNGITVNPLTDTFGHGTEVAGVIGAVGNNSNGIAGVCWNVDLISFGHYSEIVNVNGEETTKIHTENLYQDFEYAQNNDIDIMNCSFSGEGYSNIEYQAMKKYDGLIVCAAGNKKNNNDSNPMYPASYDLNNIISVAATDSNDNPADFTNYGKTSVDLAAPGVNVYTTSISGSQYISDGGTSVAAPYVAGVAALIKSLYPTMSAYGVKKAILDGVDKVSSLSGKVKTGGRLNAYNAIKSAQEHTFTVVYNSNGGSGTAMSNTTVTYGVPTKLRANTYTSNSPYTTFEGWYAHRKSDDKWIYKNGSTLGWYVEGTQPSGYTKATYNDQAALSTTSYFEGDTITLYAKWRPYRYNITYSANGGGGSSAMSSQTVAYNASVNISANIFAKSGYKFSGWYAKRNSDNKVYCANGSLRIWYNEDGIHNGYVKYLIPDKATVSNLSTVDGDVIYMTAQWEPVTYQLSFDSNGGSGTMNSITAKNEVPIVLPAHSFAKEGYCFNGWNLKDEDNLWLCTNDMWYSDNSKPQQYDKVVYENKAQFTGVVDYENEKLTLVAQWLSHNDIMIGDVNLDGKLSITDATEVQKYVAGLVEFNDVQLYAADVDGNGIINIMDSTAIQKMLG